MPTTLERTKHTEKHKTSHGEFLVQAKGDYGNVNLKTLRKLSEQVEELRKRLRAAENLEGASQIPSINVVLPRLHDEGTGRIDAEKVAEFISVPLKQLSEGLGLNYKAVHRNPAAASIQDALRPVKSILEYLHEAFRKPATIRVWLNTPHPTLDGKTSLNAILEGNAGAVERVLGNAWNAVVS